MNNRYFTMQSSNERQPATLSPFDNSKPYYRVRLPGGRVTTCQIRETLGAGWVQVVYQAESGKVLVSVQRRNNLKDVQS